MKQENKQNKHTNKCNCLKLTTTEEDNNNKHTPAYKQTNKMKAALKVVSAARKKRKTLKEIEEEYENYSGYDPEDPLPSLETASPWDSFAEK